MDDFFSGYVKSNGVDAIRYSGLICHTQPCAVSCTLDCERITLFLQRLTNRIPIVLQERIEFNADL